MSAWVAERREAHFGANSEYEKAGICGIEVAEAAGDVIRCGSGEAFRNLMSREPSDRVAVVGGGINDVDPLNLIAAIKKDCPSRKVVSLNSDWGLSFSDNADKAGVDDAVDGAYLASRFGIVLPGQGVAKPSVPNPSEAGRHRDLEIAQGEGRLGACICVASGRGGVGKSTVCILLALSAVAHGTSCAIVDADLQFGDLGFLCERDEMFSTVGFGAGFCDLGLGAIGHDTVPVLYSMERPEYSEELSYGMKQLLVECRKDRELVLVNTSTLWSDMHADLVSWCDGVLLVMDQKTTSVRGGKTAKDLCVRLGAPTSKLFYAVNRYSRSNKISLNDCAATLSADRESMFGIVDGGDQIEEALSLGIPSSLIKSGNPAIESSSMAFEKLAVRLGIELGRNSALSSHPGRRWMFGRKAGGHVVAG